ncbi:MAG: glutamine amidotransferase-related protein, partial [Planctomycetia bacterium]
MKGKTTVEAAYGITSLPPEQADAARLRELTRGRWGIENGLQWVKDVTLGEDGGRVRKGNAPPVPAALRNTAVHVLKRLNGNVKAARGNRRRRPGRRLPNAFQRKVETMNDPTRNGWSRLLAVAVVAVYNRCLRRTRPTLIGRRFVGATARRAMEGLQGMSTDPGAAPTVEPSASVNGSAAAGRERVLVLDFGSQYAQLIARRVREQNVFCEIVRHDLSAERVRELRPKGVIFSGGPSSVYEAG